MPNVKVPTNFKSNVSYTFRNDRKRWVLRYYLPYEKKEIRIEQSLPARFTKSKEKQVKKIMLEKASNLEKGKLTDKEFKRLQNSEDNKKISFNNAIREFHSLPGCTKTKSTIIGEKRSIQMALDFFQSRFKIKFLNEVQKDHVKAYKSYLLERTKNRSDKEEFANKIKAVTNDESQRFQIDLEIKKSGIAPATARTYFRDCKTLFNKLYKHEKLPINPVDEVEAIIVPKSQRVRSKTYTVDEVIAILAAPYTHSEGFPIKEFFELMMETGARRGELENIEWSDYNRENRILSIREKPLCPTTLGLGFKPKSDSSRDIHLSDRAIEILDSIPKRKSVGYIRGDETPYPAEFIFVTKDYRKRDSPNYGGWCRPNSIKTAWKSLLKSAGLAYRGMDKLCFHDLRRFRNQIDRHLHKLNDQERSQRLGHSEKVNNEHYSPNSFDQKIIALTNDNDSLRRENLLLKEKIKKLTQSIA